ncbi:ribulokinase [candidate division KSB3 bacterium]|nr:MAG: ribulokinase [candidate division KSB3 bacterium]
MKDHFVIGVDFGTDSVRAIVVNASNGQVAGEGLSTYARWSEGRYSMPEKNQFRQHPLDYLEGLQACVHSALKQAGQELRSCVKGIAIETTGSTPCPVDRAGRPLALLPEFRENPNAMFHLWKDHSAADEAEEFTRAAEAWEGEDYTRFQGRYSSEWFWAKMLHTHRSDPAISKAAFSWVEHCDWIPGLLAGRNDPAAMYRSACAAGHKALWHSEFGGLPAQAFLANLDPSLAEISKTYGAVPQPADTPVGWLTPEWAHRLGLPSPLVVGGSSFDAHAGAVGAGIAPHVLVKVIGTSSVDMIIEKASVLRGKSLKEVCGQAENSILPGFVGIEAGQAAFGDVYAWFKELLLWPLRHLLPTVSTISADQKADVLKELSEQLILQITAQAQQLSHDDISLVALDWLNGRRYPSANEYVKSAVTGLDLGTDAPKLYKSLVLATAFGARRILESFLANGLQIEKIIAVGGIAQRSPFVMQILANVLNRPISVAASMQTCAMGAAMYAATAAGIHRSLPDAQRAMNEGFSAQYSPESEHVEQYNKLFVQYCALGDFVESRLM